MIECHIRGEFPQLTSSRPCAVKHRSSATFATVRRHASNTFIISGIFPATAGEHWRRTTHGNTYPIWAGMRLGHFDRAHPGVRSHGLLIAWIAAFLPQLCASTSGCGARYCANLPCTVTTASSAPIRSAAGVTRSSLCNAKCANSSSSDAGHPVAPGAVASRFNGCAADRTVCVHPRSYVSRTC